MRLEAKRAKGPNGTLVPEDSPGARLADPLPPRVAPRAEMPAAKVDAVLPEPAPAKSQPESRVDAAKADDVAARLEAALRGHLETVASAFASTRAAAAKAEARGEQKPETPAAARSIYAPDGVRMPQAALLDIDPLPPLPAAVRPDRDLAAHDAAPSEDELADALGDEDAAAEAHAAGEFDSQADAHSYDDDIDAEDDEPADEDEFGDAPPRWLTAEEPAAEDSEASEDEPLPRAFQRRAWRKPEGLAHLPPLVETTRGVSAKVLAAATLFGLAAGVGAIATYQYVVAPVATPALALVPNHPAADSSKIAKIDADRVPQADAAVKIASAAAVPAAAPVYTAAPAVASAEPPPSPAPLASAKPATGVADAGVPPTLRATEDASAAVEAGSSDAVPSDTEPFVATVASRPAQAKRPATAGEVLAYAPPPPPPNDPVARSFFGKGDDANAAAAKKSTAGITDPSPGKAKVLMAVNMRAKPDNDAPSVKILGAGAKVQVVQCAGWCEVVADGKRGYIFKKFLDN